MAPNVLWFEEIVPNMVFTRKDSHKVAQQFFVQVWGNSGKNPSHPQKFACSYTYVLKSWDFTLFSSPDLWIKFIKILEF